MAKNYHHGDLRRALMEKTLEFVQNDEVHLIGFRELARQLDVSRTAPYRHFESVEALLAAVAGEGFTTFIEALQSVMVQPGLTNRERFVQLGIAYLHFALQNSAHYRLMFDQKYYKKDDFPEVSRLAVQAFDLLRQTSSACMPKTATAKERLQLATLAWSNVHGLSKLFIDGQLPYIKDREKFVRYSCEKLLSLV